MCKLKKSTVVKVLIFIGGAVVLRNLHNALGVQSTAEVEIDGQLFKVYGKNAGEYIKKITEGEYL